MPTGEPALPDVTVVMATKNRWEFAERAVSLVAAQRGVDLELIVVDDGSASPAPSWVADDIERLGTLLRNEESAGVSAARNAGLARARGRWVAFLDDDDVWAPDWLRTAIARGDEIGAALVYGPYLVVNVEGAVIGREDLPRPEVVLEQLRWANSVGGPSMAVLATDAVREVGGFDLGLSALADWHLWLRLMDRGPWARTDDSLVAYTTHAGNMHIANPAGVLRELGDFVALGYGADPAPAGFTRWIAQDMALLGQRRRAARTFAGVAVRTRSVSDVRAALRALRGRRSPPRTPPAWLAGDLFTRSEAAPGPLPVSVVVPTVGRPGLLEVVLASLAACDPAPAEIVLVDQSENGAAARAVATTGIAARVVEMPRFGIAAGMNAGLRAASHESVLVTHDDCRVRRDWVGVGAALLARDPAAMWTGRVLPDIDSGQDPAGVPSTESSSLPRTYDGEIHAYLLYPANMAVRRRDILELGGFDERFIDAGEDNDLCLRWLADGRRLSYAPELTVWHHDWRSPEELRQLYRRYALAQGALFAKYLRVRPKIGLRLLAEEYGHIARAVPRRARMRIRGTGAVDHTYSAVTHIPLGLARSWRLMAPGRGPGRDAP